MFHARIDQKYAYISSVQAFLAKYAKDDFGENNVCIVRSSCDILNLYVLVDDRAERSRRFLVSGKFELIKLQRKALLGMHVFR